MAVSTNQTKHPRTKLGNIATAAVGLSMLAAFAAPYATPAGAAALKAGTFSDPAFERVWSRTDKPVEERKTARSWMWGPEGLYSAYEQYMEGPGGQHLVTYFDKSRMEINAPAGDRNSQWYVTNGLLVVDMMSGRIQTGNNSFAPFYPNNAPVAGDVKTSGNAPTYATLAKVASLKGDNRAPNRTGQAIQEGLGRNGNVGILQNLSGFSKYAVYEPTMGHNIPDVFWQYMNQRGPIFKDGRYADDVVVDWLFAMGYPITEPYWIQINVGGQDRWVLMQAFQRRILTYSPYNPEGWKVEMGNVGRAYFDWRYTGQTPPPAQTPAPPPAQPTPTTAPSALRLGINPTQGDLNTVITVSASGFQPNVNVTLLVENGGAGYQRQLGVVATNNKGEFSTQVRVPADASRLGEVRITAVSGAQRVSQTYRLVFDPSIRVTPDRSVVNGGSLRVQGTGFPGKTDGRVGILVNDTEMLWLQNLNTNDQGNFDVTVNIGRRPVNAVIQVIATVGGNYKAVSGRLNVYEAPIPVSVNVNPGVLGVGQTALVTGSGWQPGARVSVGLGYTEVLEWVAAPVADANGNINASFVLGARWTNGGQLTLFAATADKLATTKLNVAGSGGGPVVPQGHDMRVGYYGAPQNIFKIRGFGWPAGQTVNLTLFSKDGTINVPVGSGAVKNDGSLQINFQPAAPWAGRADLGLRATAPNGAVLSVRYFPAVSIGGATVAGNSHAITARHLPANTPVEVVVHIDGQGDKVLGSGVTDGAGNVTLNVSVPRIPSQNENDIEFRTKDGQYSAIFEV
ncbi:MAG: hypothetical protein M3441_09865 [Chloroflexota bacterium]|nr:hypothetical protein [Chloroflexota bacterium]